jgi:hypothetical protein
LLLITKSGLVAASFFSVVAAFVAFGFSSSFPFSSSCCSFFISNNVNFLVSLTIDKEIMNPRSENAIPR